MKRGDDPDENNWNFNVSGDIFSRWLQDGHMSGISMENSIDDPDDDDNIVKKHYDNWQ